MLLFNKKHIKEIDGHNLIAYISDKKVGLEGYIAIHRKNSSHPSFGATRLWNYSLNDDAIKEALRLSRAMSYKSALAGLPCGGGKAVLMSKKDAFTHRKEYLKSYAKKVNLLGGNFITGSDVGITRDDVMLMRKVSPYFVGVKTNPEKFTAMGLLYGLETCLLSVFGSEDLANRSFAIQGVGKIGTEFLKLIYSKAKEIYVADIDTLRVGEIKKMFPGVIVVTPQEIHKVAVDIFSPCALSNCINHRNVAELKCKAIVGGANNQLENSSIGSLLHRIGIVYAPDYVVNAGGLISVYDEYEYGNTRVKRVEERMMPPKNLF